jgi:hypothetical protein
MEVALLGRSPKHGAGQGVTQRPAQGGAGQRHGGELSQAGPPGTRLLTYLALSGYGTVTARNIAGLGKSGEPAEVVAELMREYVK